MTRSIFTGLIWRPLTNSIQDTGLQLPWSRPGNYQP